MGRQRVDPQLYATAPTIAALAVVLGCSTQQVQRLINAGIPRADDKSFPLPEVVRWLETRAAQRGEARSTVEADEEDAEDDGDAPRSWKVRKERAHALRAELDLEHRRSRFLTRELVEQAFAQRLQLVTQGLRGLAAYLGKRLNLSTREQEVVDESAERLVDGYRGGSIVELVEQWQESSTDAGRISRGRGRPRKAGGA